MYENVALIQHNFFSEDWNNKEFFVKTKQKLEFINGWLYWVMLEVNELCINQWKLKVCEKYFEYYIQLHNYINCR